jgi:predicted transcriptional regulator
MSEGGESYNLKGEYHSQAKLTKLEVEEIRDLLRNTKIPYEEIANKYNVSKATISNINTGST